MWTWLNMCRKMSKIANSSPSDVIFQAVNAPKLVYGRGSTRAMLGKLTTHSQTPSRLRRGTCPHPSPSTSSAYRFLGPFQIKFLATLVTYFALVSCWSWSPGKRTVAVRSFFSVCDSMLRRCLSEADDVANDVASLPVVSRLYTHIDNDERNLHTNDLE